MRFRPDKQEATGCLARADPARGSWGSGPPPPPPPPPSGPMMNIITINTPVTKVLRASVYMYSSSGGGGGGGGSDLIYIQVGPLKTYAADVHGTK